MIKDDYTVAMGSAFKRTAYGRWLADEGVATHEDWAVEDVWKLQTAPWPRMGVDACFINIYGMIEGRRAMFVADIPPRGATEPIHHLYEEIIFILEGNGTTEVWQEGDSRKHIFEWRRGSVFSPPLNAWHRLYNLGNEPVKFMAINRAPSALNEFNTPDFIFNCPYAFRERFDGQEDFFKVGKRQAGDHENSTGEINSNMWATNFVPDAFGTDLDPHSSDKVPEGTFAGIRMAGNQMMGHISAWPVGHYHKAHYHGPGSVLFGLRSEGYVLMWPRAIGSQPYASGHGDEVVDVRWGRGSIYAPPAEWFHAHFNTGREPARNFAVYGSNPYSGTPLGRQAAGGTNTSTRHFDEGGTMLAYEDEDPEVRRRFQEALRQNGVESQMAEEMYVKGYLASNAPRR